MLSHLAPRPQQVVPGGGTRTLLDRRTIVLAGDAVAAGLRGGRDVQAALERYAGLRWELRAAASIAEHEGLVAVLDPRAVRQREGYHLTVGDERIGIVAHDAAGLYYACQTLVQLLRQHGRRLPLLHIEDYPDFAHRGVMLDISRDKVPTMQTLCGLVDMLAGWKVNELQLYMEHTFAYERHRAVWKDASPLTGDQVLALDAYCRERHVELVPNQNSFGHMERWLAKRPYRDFAEAPRGVPMPWGRLQPFTLDPADPRSLALLDELYAELLPHFSSARFNVGCDETFELGRGKSAAASEQRGVGRVYLDFLLKIHDLCETYGRRMMFWGDIVLQHPDLIDDIPSDVIALDWGYEHDHPFDQQTRAFRKAGRPFYVCPGAGGWNSFLGRTDNTVANIHNATAHGKKQRAAGVLTTEWGDNGHMQPLPVAWLGMLCGASMSWSPAASEDIDLARALSVHAFDDPSGVTGDVACALGNAYNVNGAKTRNGSLLAQLCFRPLDDDWPMQRGRPGGFDDTLDYLEAEAARLDASHMRRDDATVIVDELRMATELARAGAAIGAAKHARHSGATASTVRGGWKRASRHLQRALPEYERLWHVRNRPGGYPDSVARLEQLLGSLQDASGTARRAAPKRRRHA